MQIIAPDYYKSFKCIAGDCKHSCCIGWEIDIDADTLDIYKNISGDWCERFKNSISYEGGAPRFITDYDGRCAFLNKNGLCDIISAFGEDGLCQICYDHPRFRNFYSDRVEIGLGLCCEAAATLILNKKDKIHFVVLENDDATEEQNDIEIAAFKKRNELFNLFQNNDFSVKEILNKVCEEYGVNPFSVKLSEMVKKYRDLERLDTLWDEFLNKTEQSDLSLKHIISKASEKAPIPFKNLLYYFTYRYFTTETVKGNERGAINFILESACFCFAATLSYYGDLSAENLCEVCRMFSGEIEYSEENVEFLLKEDN